MFSIDAESGNINTSQAVDFTASATINLVVLATDLGQNAMTASATVIVVRRVSVAENSPEDTFIAHVIVSDADFGRAGEVNCSLQADDDDAQNFHLVPLFSVSAVSSYRAFEYKLVSSARFDRENRSVYELSVMCRDFGEPPRWVRHSLVVEITDVDDNVPVFDASSYNFTVVENNLRGQVIGQVSASDADDGPNTRVLYSLGSDSDSSAWFDVDPSSGVITAIASFDREFVNHFQFIIFASSLSSSSSQVPACY